MRISLIQISLAFRFMASFLEQRVVMVIHLAPHQYISEVKGQSVKVKDLTVSRSAYLTVSRLSLRSSKSQAGTKQTRKAAAYTTKKGHTTKATGFL